MTEKYDLVVIWVKPETKKKFYKMLGKLTAESGKNYTHDEGIRYLLGLVE